MIKQIGLPLRGRPILLITRMITDRIGLHSVLLPLLIHVQIYISLPASTEFSIDSIIQLIILCTVRTYRETDHFLAVVFCCQLIFIHWRQVFNRIFPYYNKQVSITSGNTVCMLTSIGYK